MIVNHLFLLPQVVFANGSQVHKEQKKDFFIGRVERDVAPLLLLGEELYNMVSKYGDIVFGFQFGKQKFPDFGLTHN
jgi:hypothetical protein